jgi:hypothetical protein
MHQQDSHGDDQDQVAPSEVVTEKPSRRGDVEKCPVCGSHVDAESYHCPSCRNYFCFHCRARLIEGDTQLQCYNQDCDYYGKLICGVCDSIVEKDEPPALYSEPEDGYWPAWLLLVILMTGMVWYFSWYLPALIFAIAAFVGGGYLFQSQGVNIFGREREVEHARKSSYYTCISCQQPVKELHRT